VIATRAMSFGRPAAIFVLALLVAAPATAEMVNRIVATVDGDPITAHEVRRYGEARKARDVPHEALLEAVITERILTKEIAARKITARKEDVDRYVEETIARNKLTPEQFEKALKEQGMTLEQYRVRVKSEMERTQLLGQELRSEPPEVGDDEVRRYYDDNKDDFAQRSHVTVRDIFFAFRPEMTQKDVMAVIERAKNVKRMLDSGQSFDGLARKYTEGPGADRGGLLGSFGRGEMEPQLEHVAFALPVGQVSPPVVSPQGVHLLKLEAAQNAGAAVPFDDVKDDIRQALVNQKLDERFREWVATNLRTRHHVEVLN
jgi:peptidyl-prolyl cis-trans isomerase SurA